MRCAAPETLEAADAESDAVRGGLIALQRTTQTHYVEARLGMRRGNPDIQRDRVMRWFSWLRRERDNGHGKISNVYVDIIPEGETQTEHLNLLKGQIGGRRRLDLPEDDPAASYRIRESFLAEVFDQNRAELEDRYRR